MKVESEFKGTKGEWLWEENSASDRHGSTCIEVSTNGPQIAYLQSFSGWEEDYGREVTIANANLISAAPELLAELIKARKIIEESGEWWMDSPDRGGFNTESMDAAINKALGK